ncbi:hypothetical protein ACEQ8H_006532 [Pleosporales sp. CAS-2024a]
MSYDNQDWLPTSLEDSPWFINAIDSSVFGSTFTQLEGLDCSQPGGVFDTHSLTSEPVEQDTAGRSYHQPLPQSQVQESPVQGSYFDPPPMPRFDSHSSSGTSQQGPTPPLSSSLSPTISPPPRRRGRPRIYPRPNSHEHISPTTSSSLNPTYSREQNRLAAQRFRARHEAYLDNLNAQAAELTAKNKELKTKVASLREEMLGLRYDVLKHEGCGCGILNQYIDGNLEKIVGTTMDTEGEGKDNEKGIQGRLACTTCGRHDDKDV